jgi:TolA-binding protein
MAAIPATVIRRTARSLPPVFRDRSLSVALTVAALVSIQSVCLQAGPLDELPLDRWAKLREAERYQMNIAEKFFRERQWKIAAAEYEKYLKLYPEGEGSAYAQLKWSQCLAHERQLHTAIRDGYQTLLDYYPDSPEAPIAAYLIGRTYLQMGDLRQAKASLSKAIATYPKHFVAVMARMDLVEVASKENDAATRLRLLRELTYDVDRTKQTSSECIHAGRLLCQHYLREGDFAEGLKALATTTNADSLVEHMMRNDLGRLPQTLHELSSAKEEALRQRGERLASAAVQWLNQQAAALGNDPAKKDLLVRTWFAIADVWGSAGQRDKQKATYEEMIKNLGADDTLLSRIAQWFKENNQREQARATYAKFKNQLEGQHQIAWSYVEENAHDKAVEIYRKLAIQDEKQVGRWLSQAALVYRYAGKPDQAIAIYRELLTADAQRAGTWHWEIAETLFYANRWKEAITAYRGTEYFPTNYFRMAAAHRRLKQFDEAIALYRQILAGYPAEAAEALLQIAFTHEEAEQKEPAIKVFKQVCDRFPKLAQASRAHAHLNEKYKITVTLGGAKD